MTEDKKYQVFVSSTYKDLREARQRVMFALLEMNCIPAGMELFPAADESQWKVIQRTINESDYYILILGGRYGSIAPNSGGMSYTEMEYRYALEHGIPILRFPHENPKSLLTDNEARKNEEGKWEKLEAFRAFVQDGGTAKHWNTPDELYGKVSSTLAPLLARSNRPGWVRKQNSPILSSRIDSPSGTGKNKWAVLEKINPKGQKVVGKTNWAGNDHCARIWVLQCQHCGFCYGANGGDVFQRKCPNPVCSERQQGKPCSYPKCEAKARNKFGNCNTCRQMGGAPRVEEH